jgi:hypothetical protein
MVPLRKHGMATTQLLMLQTGFEQIYLFLSI